MGSLSPKFQKCGRSYNPTAEKSAAPSSSLIIAPTLPLQWKILHTKPFPFAPPPLMAPGAKSAALASFKKIVTVVACLLGKGFSTSKCKTELKLAIARIKLLRNRREAQIRLMRRDIAALLSAGQDCTARIRVEHVIREQNIMAANEIIELFCELIVVRLPIIAKQRDCPADIKEGICSLLFASPRCSEIPELLYVRDIFGKKYGKDFVSAAIELRPNSGVNRMLIEKLSIKTPPGEVKLKVMKEIAKEFQVEWNTKETEEELLKPPDGKLGGPSVFVSASSMPVKPVIPHQDASINNEFRSFVEPKHGNGDAEGDISAARAAVELAEKAVAVAQAAANLAKQASADTIHTYRQETVVPVATGKSNPSTTSTENSDFHRCKSPLNDQDLGGQHHGCKKSKRNARTPSSEIIFDDSDGAESDDDNEEAASSPTNGVSHPPPNRPAPKLPPYHGEAEQDTNKQNLASSRVHPKLPDYDTLAARFEALKTRRFS